MSKRKQSASNSQTTSNGNKQGIMLITLALVYAANCYPGWPL